MREIKFDVKTSAPRWTPSSAAPLFHKPRSSDTLMTPLCWSKPAILWVCASPEAYSLPHVSRWAALTPSALLCLISHERRRLQRKGLNLFEECCLCFLHIHSGHQVRWTYQPGSHRRKVTHDFSSTLLLPCVP